MCVCVCADLSIDPLVSGVADVGRVGQHVGPVDVVDRFCFGKSGKVLVVQKLFSKLCLQDGNQKENMERQAGKKGDKCLHWSESHPEIHVI